MTRSSIPWFHRPRRAALSVALAVGCLGGASGAVFAAAGMFRPDGDAKRPASREATATWAQAPATWIGVRLSPVPDALAAHLNQTGLMVANVAKGSPADRAGLERYDVFVSFNGKPVAQMEDLTGAIAELGPGNAAPVSIVRGGKTLTLSVAPEPRPEEPAEFKYDEPAAGDEMTQFFGHRLKLDPQGVWVFEPLGRLKDLPGPLHDWKGADDPAWKAWIDDWRSLQLDPFKLRLQVDPADPDATLFFFPDGEPDADARVAIAISVKEDGRTVQIQRGEDGRITVTRTDPDGTSSTSTYDNLDVLREKDADAYRTYRNYTGYRQKHWLTVPPNLKDLRLHQEQWRRQLEESVRKLQEEARRLPDAAGRLQTTRERLLKRMEAWRGSGGTTTSSTSLHVDAEGRIRVIVTRDGDVRRYEFDGREDFRKQEPALYESVKELLDEGWDDDGLQSRGPREACETA